MQVACECHHSKAPRGEVTADDKGGWDAPLLTDPQEKVEHMKVIVTGEKCEIKTELAFGKTALKYE